MMQGVACEGDTTDSGGRLIEGSDRMQVEGRRVAFEGAQAYCPVHGATVIAEGTARMSVEGRRLARAGDRLACGHRIVIDGPRRLQSTDGDGRAACSRSEVSRKAVSELRHRHGDPGSALREATTSRPAGAPVIAPAGETAPSAERRCVLRIGVFFDGTNNNAGNVQTFDACQASSAQALGQDRQERQAVMEHCQAYMSKPGTSYDNGVTNVWRLYQLYRDSAREPLGAQAGDYFMRVYVPGIGTTTGEPDNPVGMALGIGETGVLARVTTALTRLLPDEIDSFAQKHAGVSVEGIEVDVFGFSRGAAAARYFVHEINRGADSPLMSALRGRGIRLTTNFEVRRDLRVGFVGLFDTVVSRASLADGFDVRGGHHGPLKVALPAGCARQVVHLVARDEHRANFMLTTVQPEHREIVLPGAHSDLGGGYRGDREGPQMLLRPFRSVEAIVEQHGFPYLPALEQTAAFRQAQALRGSWLARLGYPEMRAVTVDAWQQMETAPHRPGEVRQTRQPVTYATLRLERAIDARYQLIPLRVMHRLAQEAGVTWRASPEDDLDMRLPAELVPIAEKLMAHQPLRPGDDDLLARGYLHQSAHWNVSGYAHLHLDGLFYVHRPDPSGRRVILPNENH